MSAEEDEEEIIIPEETVNLFAVSVLGINLDTEQDLLYVAEDALYDKALKENGWQVHIEPAQKLAYFYNENSQESVWVHPEAEKWKKRLQKQRAKLQKEKDLQKEKGLQKEQVGINLVSNDSRNLKQQNDKGSIKGWKAAGVTGGNSSSTEPIVVSNVPNNKADQAKTSSKPADPNDEVILIEEFEDFGSDNLDKKASASESSSRLGDSSGNGALATEKTKKSVSFGLLSTSADFLDGPSSGSGNSGNSSNTVDNKKDKEPNSAHPTSLKQSANTDASNYINNSGSKSNVADTTSLIKDSAKGSSSINNSSNRNASSSVPIVAEKENKRTAGVETDRPLSLSGRISASSINNVTTTTGTSSSSLDDISGAKSDSWSWKSKETVQSQQDINRSASPTRAAAGQPGPVNYSNAVPYQDVISLDRHKLMMMEGESKLKAQVTGLEVELKTYKDLVDSERQKRLDSDEKSREKINELEVKLQSIEMDNDVKYKVMVKKLKLDADEEFEYKLKTTENKFNEEIEGLKTDTLSLRKKNEELMREADALKRKADLIREETKVEQAVEIETMKREQALHVEREAKLVADLKKMKDEHISLVTKLTVTSQALQVTQAEKDAIESASMHSKHESASNHSALVMATQRINELEGDNGKLRAENSLLSRASEAARLDRQKEASQSSYAEEKVEQLHREIAKIKAAAQADQGKLSSRVIELETIQNALRKQVQTEAEAHELEARELKRASARLETECDRYKEKNHDLDIRSNNDQIRITQMEKEVFILKERVHDRDKQLKDEEIRYSLMRDSIADIRREIEKDSVKLRQDLDNEIKAHKDSKARHIGDLDAMKLDVAERIPKLTALAVEGVEAKMVVKMRAEAGAEIARVTAKYTEIIDELRQELDAMKMTSSNKERKMLAAHAHELDMLQDKHKSDIARLKGDNKELELKLESSRLSSVHSTPRLTYQDDFNAHVHNLSNLSYSDRSGVSPSFSFNPVRNNNNSSNNNISNNTADRRNAPLSNFNSSFNPNFRGHGQAPPMLPHMLPQQQQNQQNQQNQQSFTHPESASFDHAGAGLSTIIDSSSISNQNTSQIIGNQGGLGSINEAYFAQLMQTQLDNMMKVLSQNKPSHDIIGDGGRGGYSHSTFTPTKKAVDGKRQQFQQQRGDDYSNRSNQNYNSRGADQEDLSIFKSPAREDYYSSRNFDDMNNNNNKMYDNRGGNRGGDMNGLSRVRFERSLDGNNYSHADDRNYQQQRQQQQQQGRYQSGAPDHTTSNSFTNSSARPNQSFNSHNNSNNNNHNNHNNSNNNNNNNGIDREAADEDYLVEDGGYHDGYWKAKYAKESIM